MKILVLSDLHLSHSPYSAVQNGQRVDTCADVVVLAGDIDDGLGGFRWARQTFPDKPIVMVAGNHEFYGCHWVHHLDDMREAANTYGIHFLENEGVELAGVRFLGCSLWTDFELFGAEKKTEAMRLAKSSMNDYRYIKISRTPEFYWVNSRRLIPALSERRHRDSVVWLEAALATEQKTEPAMMPAVTPVPGKGEGPRKTVVVTHHAPHPNSIPMPFDHDLLSTCYASDLTRLMGKADLWVHGHMHSSSDYVVNCTRVVSNPKGYLQRNGEAQNTGFGAGWVVEV